MVFFEDENLGYYQYSLHEIPEMVKKKKKAANKFCSTAFQ